MLNGRIVARSGTRIMIFFATTSNKTSDLYHDLKNQLDQYIGNKIQVLKCPNFESCNTQWAMNFGISFYFDRQLN